MKKKIFKKGDYDFIASIIALLILSLEPLIMRMKILDYNVSKLPWYNQDTKAFSDIFTYYKASFVIMLSIVSLIIIIFYTFQEDRKIKLFKQKPFFSLYGYCLLAILATLFSVNRYISMKGFIDHFENIFVLLSYIILFFLIANFLDSENSFKRIINFWIISIVILFIIGLTQFWGHDIIFSDFMKNFIIPSKYDDLGLNLSNKFGADSPIYQTLFHYNYVSFYAALATPFFFSLLILDENKQRKLIYLIIQFIMIFNLIASGARNGFIGVILGYILAIIFLRKRLSKYKFYLVGAFTLLIVFAIGVDTLSGGIMTNRIKQTINDLSGQPTYQLHAIETLEDRTIIDHKDFYIEMKYTPNSGDTPYTFYDRNSNPIPMILSPTEQLVYYLESNDSNNFKNFKYQLAIFEGKYMALLTIDNVEWPIIYNDNNYYYINSYGALEHINTPESIGFHNSQHLASYRGYIWSKTLPIILGHPLLGTGPDTFTAVFPQNDYVAKYNYYKKGELLVDKPHNIYLGYALTTGIPSLILLLIFWGFYIIQSIKLYFNCTYESYYSYIGLSAFLATTSYLSSGIFNDTNLSITPLFWIVLGIGYAANKRVKSLHN